jgi:uncharacterized membrane protein
MSLFYFTDLKKWSTFMYYATDFQNIPIYNEFLLWTLQENLFLIGFAILSSTPFFRWLITFLQHRIKGLLTFAMTAIAILLIFISTTGLLNQTYKAFLYFQF